MLNCGQRESSATIKDAPKAYTVAEAGVPKPVITMDCRGCEFTDFKPDVCGTRVLRTINSTTNSIQGQWEAVGAETSTKFAGIDLSDGSWYDYDEKAGEEVSVEEVKWDVKRA